MIGKRFFVNWLHIFKMKKLRHVESDKLSAGYFYFGLNAQKQKKKGGARCICLLSRVNNLRIHIYHKNR